MSIKDDLFKLSSLPCNGKTVKAADFIFDELSKYVTRCERSKQNNNIFGFIEGENNYNIMLDAHIDEVGFIVTDIDDNGFLTVSNVGGIDLRTLPGKTVTIYGKKEITGVFISIPPHLGGNDFKYDDISVLKIDSLLGESAKNFISLGDAVTYKQEPKELLGNRITGKSLDDRVGVCVLLELARRLSGKKLSVNVVFSLVDAEELGMRGAIPATFSILPDEAIAVDVTFGTAPDVSEIEGGMLGKGPMIGVSPILDRSVTDKLNTLAYDNGISYQNEIMGGKTGTDSDVISVSGTGVKTGLVSLPLRNMHTDCEVVDLSDIEACCDIIEKYILSGGCLNARNS